MGLARKARPKYVKIAEGSESVERGGAKTAYQP